MWIGASGPRRADQFGEHDRPQRLERMQVAEERRLGDRHRLDDAALHPAELAFRVRLVEQLADRGVTQLVGERRQARLGQVLLPWSRRMPARSSKSCCR